MGKQNTSVFLMQKDVDFCCFKRAIYSVYIEKCWLNITVFVFYIQLQMGTFW